MQRAELRALKGTRVPTQKALPPTTGTYCVLRLGINTTNGWVFLNAHMHLMLPQLCAALFVWVSGTDRQGC